MSAVLEKVEFKISPDKVYRIYEKLDGSTPNELKELHRYKMVANTIEPARCMWVGNPHTGRYDTGLDTTSKDFRGLTEAQAKTALKDKQKLINYYESRRDAYLKRNTDKSETDFLASEECGIELRHGLILDTSNMDIYMRLYLAFRGGQITPDVDTSNPKYNPSLFAISLMSTENDNTESKFDKEARVITWYTNHKANDNLEDVIKTLQYVGALAYGRTATAHVVGGILQQHIKDVTKLDELLKVIDSVEIEEIYIKTKINHLIKKMVIKREDNVYYYKGNALGKGLTQIYDTITNHDNTDILAQIQAEK